MTGDRPDSLKKRIEGLSPDGDIKASMTFCPACGRGPLRAWFVKENPHGRFPILLCPECRSAFVWPRPGGNDMASFYRNSSYKNETIERIRCNERIYYPDASTDAARIIALCRKLAQGRRFLDIGAGFGEFSRAAARSGMNVTACEPNANSRRIFAELNGFEPEPSMFDKRYAQEYEARFDVALASHVLEHVTEPGAFVENLSLVLKPGGIGAIAVPHYGSMLSRFQGKNDMFISPPEHLNFFSRRGLVRLFERKGFDLLVLRTVSKVNRTSVGDRLRWRLLRPLAWRTVYFSLRVSDVLGRGMVLNAFFKKSR